MCCTQLKSHCECNEVSSNLWSTAKKIRVLQEKLEKVDDQKNEIEVMIDELKGEQ